MSADLCVSLFCRCAFPQIEALKYCIGAESPADLQHGSLNPALFFQCIIIGKEVKLIDTGILFYFDRAYSESSVEKAVVGPAVKLVQKALPDDGDAGRSRCCAWDEVFRKSRRQGRRHTPGSAPGFSSHS